MDPTGPTAPQNPGFTLVADLATQLGECPLWSVAEQALYLVDIKARRILRFDPAMGATAVIQLEEEVGCIGLAKGGGFVAALRSGICLLDRSGRVLRRLAANPEDQATSRFNDGTVDPAGRFIAGTIDETRSRGDARFYRYDRRGLVPLFEGLMTANGTAFSPDGRRLYHSDTPRFTIFVSDYDPASGAVANTRVFARLEPSGDDRGRPDGAAVDVEGCYWTALYEGGRVQRYAPDGRLMAEYPVPLRCPTMVAFGGPRMTTLYLTSARAGRDEAELARFPQSGGLFALEAGVAGLPKPLFDPDV
jgi:sugar lactone lactonase YvrE